MVRYGNSFVTNHCYFPMQYKLLILSYRSNVTVLKTPLFDLAIHSNLFVKVFTENGKVVLFEKGFLILNYSIDKLSHFYMSY